MIEFTDTLNAEQRIEYETRIDNELVRLAGIPSPLARACEEVLATDMSAKVIENRSAWSEQAKDAACHTRAWMDGEETKSPSDWLHSQLN